MRTEYHTLIRTGKLHQLEAADLALVEAGIPHNLQEECISGMRTAMPIDPSSAPGTWWTILVPTEHVIIAQRVIGQLPFDFTTNPDVWDCAPSQRNKRVLSIGIWIAITTILLLLIIALTRA